MNLLKKKVSHFPIKQAPDLKYTLYFTEVLHLKVQVANTGLRGEPFYVLSQKVSCFRTCVQMQSIKNTNSVFPAFWEFGQSHFGDSESSDMYLGVWICIGFIWAG